MPRGGVRGWDETNTPGFRRKPGAGSFRWAGSAQRDGARFAFRAVAGGVVGDDGDR